MHRLPLTSRATEQPKTRVAFVDMGRAIAALLIVYSHIDALFLRTNENRSTWLTSTIDGLVRPLGLDRDAIGYVSVPFFFLVSGFVVTPMAMKIGSRRFAIKFVCRLLPLLIFAVLLSALAVGFGLRPLTTGHPQPVTIGGIVSNILLINFLHKPINAFVGVSWSLVPEVTFYLLLIALIPLFRRIPWLAIALELEFVHLVLTTRGHFGVDYRDFAANVAYLTLAIIGQSAFAAWRRRIPIWLGVVFAAIALGLYGWAAQMSIDPDYVLLVRPVLYSTGLFVLGLAGERLLRQRAIWTALSERTYALYLLHGVVAFPIMFLLYDVLPLWLNTLIALIAMFAVVEFAYRFVDRPMNNLGRRLSGSRIAAASTPKPDSAEGMVGEGAVLRGVLPVSYFSAGATIATHETSNERTELIPRIAAAMSTLGVRPVKEESSDVDAVRRTRHGRHRVPGTSDDYPRPSTGAGLQAALSTHRRGHGVANPRSSTVL